MLRRRLTPEPYAAVATGSRGFAAFAAILAVIAVMIGRAATIDPRAALAVLAAALLFAVAAIGLALWSATVIWRTGRRGIGRALAGTVLALLVLAYPIYLVASARGVPSEDDLSTDSAVPPPFSTAPAGEAARRGIDHAEPSADMRDMARRIYPNLQPVTLGLAGDAAYALVLKTVEARGWRIVEAAPPRGKFGTGHIDAIATTRVMGLPDDVAIRIRPLEDETRVDIRAVSRFGRGDLAENAARIQSLADDLSDDDS